MISASRFVKVCALSGAIVLHGALGWALMTGTDIEVEGSTGAQEARLGTSFADMVAGTIEADDSQDTLTADPPESITEAEKIIPDEATKADPPSLSHTPVPDTTPDAPKVEVRQPDTPVQTRMPAPDALPDTPDAALAENVTPTVPLAADAVPTIAALSPPPEVAKPLKPTPAQPSEMTPPDQTEPELTTPLAPDMAQDVIKAQDNPSSAVARSLRPQRRSEAFEEKHKQARPPKSAKKRTKKQPAVTARGNSNQNATAGSATGQAAAKATTSGNAQGHSNAAGNAAASNYPGLVMKKISRVSRPRAASKGTAVIAFSIAPSGALARVSVARSSGSAQLDQAAAQMIRRAAPFPAPPAGARRDFSISIKGR
ncbi:energy transducer TonB [Roseovarius pelagicus]|uniref:TonB family protein n=1 Tax=Roseovarius pelagicus TaxID=2980108 RepID=A0ABY6DF25_9RHOB|nr:TonB family protein [Roseovarius pelagicus]UXX82385.1 TonB family protein [Roseovarius pelagicus]